MTTLEHEIAPNSADTIGLPALTALDRCDSCAAQAYVRAVLGDSELLFCAHHARQHEAKLKPLATVWQDESHRLEVTP